MSISSLPGSPLPFSPAPLPLGGKHGDKLQQNETDTQVPLPGIGPAGEALLRGRPQIRKMLAENRSALADFAKAARTNAQNALEVLGDTMKAYEMSTLKRAHTDGTNSRDRSQKIAQVYMAWNRMKPQLLEYANRKKPAEQVANITSACSWQIIQDLREALKALLEKSTYSETDLYDDIFPNRNRSSDEVSYNDINSADSIVTSICDTHQVDVDKGNQDFKNDMTLLSSSRDELKDLRREVLSLGRR